MKKKIIILLTILVVVLGTTACGEKKDLNNSEVLANTFKTEMKNNKNIKEVAEIISKNSIIETNVEVFEIQDGDYLSGFTKEITGYKNAIGIRPMIGSIPFIAYVFEVDDPNSFAKELESSADKRWNICTEADYIKTEIVDNYVFFTMIPKEF